MSNKPLVFNYERYKEALEELEKHRWIPCSERLPNEFGEYLVTVREKYPFEDDYDYQIDLATNQGDYIGQWDTKIDWDEGQEVEVIAWMPLPEPYNAEFEAVVDDMGEI